MTSSQETYNNYETTFASAPFSLSYRSWMKIFNDKYNFDITNDYFMTTHYPSLTKDCQRQIDILRSEFFEDMYEFSSFTRETCTDCQHFSKTQRVIRAGMANINQSSQGITNGYNDKGNKKSFGENKKKMIARKPLDKAAAKLNKVMNPKSKPIKSALAIEREEKNEQIRIAKLATLKQQDIDYHTGLNNLGEDEDLLVLGDEESLSDMMSCLPSISYKTIDSLFSETNDKKVKDSKVVIKKSNKKENVASSFFSAPLKECKWGIKCANVKKGICMLAHNLPGQQVTTFGKTKMCSSTLSNSVCRYGDRCTYAHSQSELSPCRYDKSCKNSNCSYFHPSRVLKESCVVNPIQVHNVPSITEDWATLPVIKEVKKENAWSKILVWSQIISNQTVTPIIQKTVSPIIQKTIKTKMSESILTPIIQKTVSFKVDSSLNKTKMCESILTGKPCKHGDYCRYAHEESEIQKRPCRNGSTCQNKKWCHFSH